MRIQKLPKIAKIVKKSSFWRDHFFGEFLDGQKTFPEGYDTLWVASKGAIGEPWAPLGDYRGINKDNPTEDC